MGAKCRIRFLWIVFFCIVTLSSYSKGNKPLIKNGGLDLGEWDFQQDGNIALKGEWAFYWSVLKTSQEITSGKNIPDGYINVPGPWTGTLINGTPIESNGCATYRLTINSRKEQSLLISFKEIISAYDVWLNGKEIIRVGVPSSNANEAKASFKLCRSVILLEQGANELIIHVSNYDHRTNGFEFAPVLGTVEQVDEYEFKGSAVDLIIFGVLLIMFFYHLGMFLFRRKNVPGLMFSLFCLIAMLRISVTSNYLLGYIFPKATWTFVYGLQYFTFYTLVPLMGLIIQLTFEEKRHKWIFNSVYILSAIYLTSLLLPPRIYTSLMFSWEVIIIFYYVLVLLFFLIDYVRKKYEGALILLGSLTLLAIATVNDMLLYYDLINSVELVKFGVFVLILGQALILGKRFSTIYDRNEQLALLLENQNSNLRDIVAERTQQLQDETRKLSESHQLLQKYFTAIEQVSASIVITNTKGEVEYVNPQFELSTGYQEEEVLGKNLRILKSGKTPIHVYDELWHSITRGKVWKGEFINLTKDKREFTEKVVISPIFDSIGEIVNFIAIKDDVTELKKTEQALKTSEEKYRIITENTLDIIWKIDLATLKYSYMSPSVLKVRGFTVEEAMSQSFEETFPPECYERAMADLRNGISQANDNPSMSFCESYQHWCKDGSIIDVELIASFLRNHDNQTTEILGVTRDITKRVKIEKELRRNRETLSKLLEKQSNKNRQLNRRLKYIYNNAENAIVFIDFIDGKSIISSCNSLWAKVMGFTPEELEGQELSFIKNPEHTSILEHLIFRLMNEKSTIQEHYIWKGVYLQSFIFPVIEESSGNITSCASFTYNISERFKAELKATETEQKFFTIFNNSHDAIVLLNMDLEIVEVNSSFLKILGADTFDSKNIVYQCIGPKYHKVIFERFEQLRKGRSLTSIEYEFIKHDGSVIPVEMTSSVVQINQQPMVLSMIRDISSRKQMEKHLTHVGIQIENRERRNLASDLHDNVGPLLSSLNMYLSVLALKPEVQPYSEILENTVRILKEAISSVREISNNLSPQVLINFGLTSALDLFFETKKGLIDVKISNNLGNYRFPEVKESMIYNIIKEAFNNSLKYSEASIIKLSINRQNEQIVVKYSDNGVGFNLNEKLSTVGSHLGLFNIINRVKILDGDYTIETSPGNGFYLEIVFSTMS